MSTASLGCITRETSRLAPPPSISVSHQSSVPGTREALLWGQHHAEDQWTGKLRSPGPSGLSLHNRQQGQRAPFPQLNAKGPLHAKAMTTAGSALKKSGKVVVVVTGVTKGLGKALAFELAARGHTVAGCGRSAEKVQLVQASLGGNHFFQVCDVASDKDVQEFATAVVEKVGVPDIVVNCAGQINPNARLWEVPAQVFDAVVDVNLKGTANVIRHFVPPMVARGNGVLVNFSSGWGRSAAAEVGPYCATKWAVEGLTKSLAKELPPGLTAVALNPGVVNTDMLQSCFGASASMYTTPEVWAPHCANLILGISPTDNGASLSVM